VPYSDGSAVLRLRSSATGYEVHHEILHWEHWNKIGRNLETWNSLDDLAREKYVYDRLRGSHIWNTLTDAEQSHARWQLREYGGVPW